MYQLASAGGTGINFHGGGYGWYTPVAGRQESEFLARPIYYGMLLFAQAGAGELVASQLDHPELALLLSAYALRRNTGAVRVAAFNKNPDRGVRLTIDPGQRAKRTDTTFGGAPVGAGGAWSVSWDETLPLENGVAALDLPAASAALVTFEGE